MAVDRDISTAYCWSSSGDDVDYLCLIISSTMAVCDWCISILAVVVNDWRILILTVMTRLVCDNFFTSFCQCSEGFLCNWPIKIQVSLKGGVDSSRHQHGA